MLDEVGYNVYENMWGKEDYVVTGSLKGYDRTKELNEIKVPSLYLTGEYDAARPETVQYYQSLTPNSGFEIISNSGHQTTHDNPLETIATIRNFLNEIEDK
jgi:proline iminopeptidase